MSCFLFLNLVCSKNPTVSAPLVKGVKAPAPKLLVDAPLPVKTPVKSTFVKPAVSQTEPRHGPTSR